MTPDAQMDKNASLFERCCRMESRRENNSPSPRSPFQRFHTRQRNAGEADKQQHK